MGKLIFIHGISSVGKSTVGSELRKYLNNAILIDQDTFYKINKPYVLLGNQNVPNWDCVEAIDFTSFNNAILDLKNNYNYVIVTGFALREKEMKIKPDINILLDFGLSEQNAINTIISGRIVSKNIKTIEKKYKDEMMVKNIVWPYYQETLTKIGNYHRIVVYEHNQRLSIDSILHHIINILNNY